ncbi:MAG: hypothetical protein SVN78_04970 [Deferribacterota bacterium]|nr:hypothetical protein [Deferribacterota bacterium]
MKTLEATYNYRNFSLKIKNVFWLIFLFFILISIVYVRVNTIKLGYELYYMEQNINKKRYYLQELYEKKINYLDNNNLYKGAKELNLEFPGYKSVYYVE